MIVEPELAVAPVIPPVILPKVQVKLLAILEVRAILGLVPLQLLAVAALVMAGDGLTETVIMKAGPTQLPVIEVGVTRYCTLPGTVLLGFVNS